MSALLTALPAVVGIVLVVLCVVVSKMTRDVTEPPEWAKRLARNEPDESEGAE